MINQLKNKINSLFIKLKNSGFIHLFGSSMINKVLAFVSSFVLVRLIPKSDYGIYSNADNILGLFCLLEGLGMTSTWLQYGCVQKGEKKQNTWSFCFYFSFIFQIALCIVIFITGRFATFGIEGTGKMLMAMSFLPLIRLVSDMQRIYLRTELMNKEYALVNNFSTITTVVLSIGLSVFLLTNGLIIANYIASFVTVVFIVLKYRLKMPKLKNEVSKGEKKQLLKFSFVCTINNSTGSIMYLLDTFVLGIAIAESTVTASYKVATKIPTALAFIPVCVMTYIYPYFAKNKDNKEWCLRNFKKTILLFGSANLILTVFLVLTAPIVIKLIFGEQYLDSVIPYQILCVNYFVHAVFGTVPGQLLVSQQKLGFNTFMGFFSSIINTVLNILLIPRYSSVGAAIATFIVTMIVGIMKTIYFIYVLKSKKVKE